MSHFTYSGAISKIKFNIVSDDRIKQESWVPITSLDLFRDGKTYPGGVYDDHLGTTDYSYKCSTCIHTKRKCKGHPGHYVLNYPVMVPIAINDIRKWLKLICFNCGNPIIKPEMYMGFSASTRLDNAQKISRVGNKKCHNCGTIHPIVKKHPHEPLALQAEFHENKKIIDSFIIYPHMMKKYLDQIDNDTVVTLGKKLESHPRNFIRTIIRIPPVTIRPEVRKISGGRSSNDDLTVLLQYIIKKSSALPPIIPNEKILPPKLDKAIWELNLAYYNYIKGGSSVGGGKDIKASSSPLNSIIKRWKGKAGRFRKTQLGKRVREMARSTIVCDPTLQIDQVGVPISFARNIQIIETVQEYNREQLMVYFHNGRKKYPGCSKIEKKSSGAVIAITGIKGDIELEIGDKIYRDVVNDDYVNFNRQPSLMISNMAAHRVVVIEDETIFAILMNVIDCPFYGADFNHRSQTVAVLCCCA